MASRFSFANVSDIEKADAVIQGAPSQAGSLHGSPASGPLHFRLASGHIYGSVYGKIWNARIADAGDMELEGNAMDIALQVAEQMEGRFPVVIGGDHSITYGIAKRVGMPMVMVDAHPDVFPSAFNHSSFLKFVVDDGILGSDEILLIGISNASRPEMEMLEETGIRHFTAVDFRKGRVEIPFDRFHLSIDIDAFYLQPGSYRAEALGIFPHEFLDFLMPYADSVSSMDLVELNPPSDISTVSGLTAARLVTEIIAMKFGRG